MYEYEEFKTLSPFWGWVVLIIFSISLMSFGMITHLFIKENQTRYWSFGAQPIAPGESRYNTQQPPKNEVSQQMKPLPDAYPLKKLSADTSKSITGMCAQ